MAELQKSVNHEGVGADNLSEDKISLVHKATQRRIIEMLNSRMPPGHTKVEVETFLDVLGELEEVQDKDGVNYNSNLINKFLDEKFNFGTTLTVTKCLAVVGHFIYRAKKHSDRVNQTVKVETGVVHKWVGTKNFLKALVTCDLCRATKVIYHWKGLPTIPSKAALTIIVVVLTLLNCILLIGVINGFSVSDMMESRFRTLRSATGELGDVTRAAVRIAMERLSVLQSDLAVNLGTQFTGALTAFRGDQSSILRLAASSACSLVAVAEGEAINRLRGSLKWLVDGLVSLQYDMDASEDTLMAYFDEVTSLWSNSSASQARLKIPSNASAFVMDAQNVTVVRGNYTTSQVAGMSCVTTLKTMYVNRSPPGTEIKGTDFHPITGEPVVTITSIFTGSLAICTFAPVSSAAAYFPEILAKLVDVDANVSASMTQTNVYVLNMATGNVSTLSNTSVIQGLISVLPTLAQSLSKGAVSSYPSLFISGSEVGVCIARTSNISFTVATTVLASMELPNAVEEASKGITSAVSTNIKLAKGTTDGYVVFGETVQRDAESATAIQLGLQGLSGAVLSRGELYEEVSAGFFPLTYLNSSYAVLFERNVADLEQYLWNAFQNVDLSVNGSHSVQPFQFVDGVPYTFDGSRLVNGAEYDLVMRCYGRGTSLCEEIGDRYSCCLKPHSLDIVMVASQDKNRESRRVAEYVGFEILVAVALVLIALAAIRFLTRTVLDHIEKDYTEYKLQVDQEKEKFAELVKDVMPSYIAHRIIKGEKLIIDHHPQLTFLFSDIVGFTEKSRKLGTTDMVRMLGYMFMLEDGIAEYYNIHKIKTIGDAYFCVAGLEDVRKRANKGQAGPEVTKGGEGKHDLSSVNSSVHQQELFEHKVPVLEAGRPEDNQVYRMVAFATTFQLLLGREYTHFPERTACFAELTGSSEDKSFNIVSIRMGIHTGPAIAGVVDVGRAPQFDCFGPSVNLASRMESTAMVDRLQLSSPTYEFLRGVDVNSIYEFDEPKKTLVKGYGTITTYHVRSTTLAVPDELTDKLHIDRATRRQFFTEGGTLGEGGIHDVSVSSSDSSRGSRSSKFNNKKVSSMSSKGNNNDDGSQRSTLRRVLSERRNKKYSSVGSRSDTASLIGASQDNRNNEDFAQSPHLGIFGDLPPLPEPT